VNKQHELTESNYQRIYRINWGLSGPLLLLFAWPYALAAEILGNPPILVYMGALFFSVPFTLTVIHGHISMALGSLHRDMFYAWQTKKGIIFRYFFHPMLFRTRFRLAMILASFIGLLAGLV
jgi:hypothetical protein